jgi:NADP-dependent 3-hydroxy acid dehydrogenase YdfG
MSRVALVAGASSGIGLATAEQLRDAGFTVHAAARREIPADGVTAHRLDVTDRAAVDALAAELGALDVLIVAAGTNIKQRTLSELTPEGWETLRGANLDGPFNLIRAFLPALREARGAVVVIASVSGRSPDRSGPGYQAAKAGAIALTHGGAWELGTEVRFTAVLPGVVDTEILENRPEPPDAEMRAQMLRAEDVAAAVVFAVSLPPRAYVPELTILPTALQAIGRTQ